MPCAARFECGSGLVFDAVWFTLVSVALVVSACRRRAPRARAGHILDAPAATGVRRRVLRSSQFLLVGGVRRNSVGSAGSRPDRRPGTGRPPAAGRAGGPGPSRRTGSGALSGSPSRFGSATVITSERPCWMISARSGSGPAARLRLSNGQTSWVLVLGARPAGTTGEPPRLIAGAPFRRVTCYWAGSVSGAAIGIGAMTMGMLRLPMSSVLLATLFLGKYRAHGDPARDRRSRGVLRDHAPAARPWPTRVRLRARARPSGRPCTRARSRSRARAGAVPDDDGPHVMTHQKRVSSC